MKLMLFLLLAMMITLSACASQPRQVHINNDETGSSAEAEPIPAASREAVFVYGVKRSARSRVVLELTGEPVLLASSYARLAGVVAGARPAVCLELGGRGLVLVKGETIDDYRIVGFSGDSVVLERGK